MKNRIFLIIIIVVFVALSFGLTSCLGGHQGRPGHKKDLHEFILFKLRKELELTDDQVTALQEIAEEIRVKKEELHKNDEEKHEKIKELITSDYLSEADVLALFDSHTPQIETMKTFLAQKIAQIHAILTPEQRIKLVEYLESLVKEGHGTGFIH